MRVAIISDIHGNLVALEAVLADVERAAPNRIVCLGDVALTGPQPREAIARVREVGCPVVMGNTDEWLLDPTPQEVESEDRQKIEEIAAWCAELLSDEDRAFLQTFQPTIDVALDGGLSLLCFHGSPRSNMEIIVATTPAEELDERLGGATATVLAGGHTHVPMIRRHNRLAVINPGSVGLPFQRLAVDGEVVNPPWAEYGLLTVERGMVGIELRCVPVDLRTLTDAVHTSGMPHAEWWTAGWR